MRKINRIPNQILMNKINNLSKNIPGTDLDICYLYDMCYDYIVEHGIKFEDLWKHNISITNGIAYFDGNLLDRVMPVIPKVPFDEYAYYIEGKILARQGL